MNQAWPEHEIAGIDFDWAGLQRVKDFAVGKCAYKAGAICLQCGGLHHPC